MNEQNGFLISLRELIEIFDNNWKDIEILSSGVWMNNPWYSAEGALKYFEFQYILSGNASIFMNGVSYSASSGHFYFCDVIKQTLCKESGLRLYFITFTTYDNDVYNRIKDCFFRLVNCPQPGCFGRMEELFNEFHYENSFCREYGSLIVKYTLIKILVTLYRSLDHPMEEKERQNSSFRHEKAVNEVVRFLNGNYGKVLKLKDIAARQSLNERYLNTLFKSITGTTIMQYLMRLRCEKAKRLLLFTSMNITDVALETGFCDCQHLCKAFKRLEGVSPMEYRRGKPV